MYTQPTRSGKFKFSGPPPIHRHDSWPAALLIGLLLMFSLPAENPTMGSAFQRATDNYARYRAEWLQGKTNTEAAWKLARAAFDCAEFATNSGTRANFADQGIQASRMALAVKPDGPNHYYLALNLGQLARTRGMSALGLIRDMEKELLKAKEFDERFDHAGADRTLGLLYRDAPGWPTSLGSWSKARLHLESALRLDGDFPENHLALAELWDKLRKTELLSTQMRLLEPVWQKAQQSFRGPEWDLTWRDWEKRRNQLLTKSERRR